jgi:hypothetical protein
VHEPDDLGAFQVIDALREFNRHDESHRRTVVHGAERSAGARGG